MIDSISEHFPTILPAAMTAIVAIYTIGRQSKVTLRNQELQLRMQAREKKFEFYKSELIRAEERTDKAVYACTQLIGIVAAEDLAPNTDLSISSDIANYFASSSAVVPITTKKLVIDLNKSINSTKDFVQLLENRTEKLETFTTPLKREKYKEYSSLLAEVLHLQGQCYALLMEEQALKALDENEIFPSFLARLKRWFVGL